MLKNQIQMFSITTKDLYDQKESKVDIKIMQSNSLKDTIRQYYAIQFLESKYDVDLPILNQKYEELKSKGKLISADERIEKSEIKDNIYRIKSFNKCKVDYNTLSNYIIKKNKFNDLKKDKLYESEEYIALSKYFATVNKLIKDNKDNFVNRKYSKLINSCKAYLKVKENIIKYKSDLANLIKCNDKIKRILPEESLYTIDENMNQKAKSWKTISVFESDLSRILELKTNELTKDLIVCTTYYYGVVKSMIIKSFTFLDEEYIILTCSAGMIRKKKLFFIRKSVYDKCAPRIMCGLDKDIINSQGGMNVNKYMSYLALEATASEEWTDFDINRAIVIPDFETEVFGTVDYIELKKSNENKIDEDGNEIITYDIDLDVKNTRKNMNIPVQHSDGCGWILPSKSKKNIMVRLPWVKGLLTPCKYLDYCKIMRDGNYMITDIYGNEWDLRSVEVVFSKSQFKLYDQYQNTVDSDGNITEYGWNKYTKAFTENKCKANICNIEEDEENFQSKKISYQMLQTLINTFKKLY